MEIIGRIKCYKATNRESVRFYLRRNLKDLLGGKDITFNYKKMQIKKPTIDCTKIYSIRDSVFAYKPKKEEDIPGLIGEYDVYKKDEDTFILKKQ